jgi:hypothetical protein
MYVQHFVRPLQRQYVRFALINENKRGESLHREDNSNRLPHLITGVGSMNPTAGFEPRSSALGIPNPVLNNVLMPGSNINTHYPGTLHCGARDICCVSSKTNLLKYTGPTGQLIDDDDDDGELTQLERQAQYTAMLHLGSSHEEHNIPREGSIEKILLEHRHGEGKGLTGAAFITDPNPLEGDGTEETAYPTQTTEVSKSAPMNVKSNYDIRDRAGFFSKKSRKQSSVDLSGPLVYPREFSPPNSSQSRKQRADRDAQDITSAREKSHPRSRVTVGQSVTSRYVLIVVLRKCMSSAFCPDVRCTARTGRLS